MLKKFLCCSLSLLLSINAYAADVSPLEKHMAYFADKYGQLTRDSMQAKLLTMGFTPEMSFQIADKVSFYGGLIIKWVAYAEFTAKEAVGKLNHARNTGIYNLDGSINEERWAKLRTYAEIDNGVEIITETKFYEYLKWCRDNDPASDIFGSAAKASDDEWAALFMVATDHWKKSGNDYERSFTIKTLRKFYEDTPALFDEVTNHHLPVPKPQ